MASIKDVIAASILGTDEDEDTSATEGTADQAEATDEEVTTPGSEGTDEKDTSDEGEGTADEAEAPTEYFGVDLSDLSAEQRAEVIAGYQERDKFIQQLLRDKSDSGNDAGDDTSEASAPDDESDAVMSDEDILTALGIDKDDPYSEQTAKVALPLAKLVIDLNNKVDSISSRAELDSTERYWTTSLAALESQYGKLPSGITHEAVMREAAKQSIAEPMDAYWRIAGPGRQAVMEEVTKRRAALAETLKKGTSTQKRPSAQVEATESVIDAKDVKEAMQIAISQFNKERGIS